MKTSRLAVLAAACGSIAFALQIEAAPPAAKAVGDSTTLERVLRGESLAAVDRRAQLDGVLNAAKPAPAARWQAGYVKDGQSWRPFESVELSTSDRDRIAEYERRRADSATTASSQLELADWCRQNKLPDRERAHLYGALGADPQGKREDILTRLGHRQVAGAWLSPEQILEWQQLNRQAEISLQKWGARLEQIGNQLSDGRADTSSALLALRKLAEPAAIPAIEFTLCGRNESCALAAVDAISRLTEPAATASLTRLGVFSEWAPVRLAAARGLKPRRQEDFVPALIALLSLPIRTEVWIWETRNSFFGENNSKLLYSYVMSRETEHQYEVQRFNGINYTINRYAAGLYRGQAQAAILENRLAVGRLEGYGEIKADIRKRDQAVADKNDRIQDLNHRVATVLAAVSDQPPSADPKDWWAWWTKTADSELTRAKRIAAIDNFETQGNPAAEYQVQHSCFAAGTPVWTNTGTKPVEAVRIGDLVLSKDVESGELAYKPVLYTSVRVPRELLTLRLDDESIVCTKGHRFWESGNGWVKARDLGSASLIHTARGSTPVWTATKGETASTYNLVVADFHTYFVGRNAILSQDLLIPRPTSKIVPGLERAPVAPERQASGPASAP